MLLEKLRHIEAELPSYQIPNDIYLFPCFIDWASTYTLRLFEYSNELMGTVYFMFNPQLRLYINASAPYHCNFLRVPKISRHSESLYSCIWLISFPDLSIA